MQVARHDGILEMPTPFSKQKLDKALAKPTTKEVKVFNGTPEEIAFRKKLSVKSRSIKFKNKKRE